MLPVILWRTNKLASSTEATSESSRTINSPPRARTVDVWGEARFDDSAARLLLPKPGRHFLDSDWPFQNVTSIHEVGIMKRTYERDCLEKNQSIRSHFCPETKWLASRNLLSGKKMCNKWIFSLAQFGAGSLHFHNFTVAWSGFCGRQLEKGQGQKLSTDQGKYRHCFSS